MFFFRKKKLLEMEHKLDKLLCAVEAQGQQISGLENRIITIEKQQEAAQDSLRNIAELFDRRLAEYTDLLDQEQKERKEKQKYTLDYISKRFAEMSTQIQKNMADANKLLLDEISPRIGEISDSNEKMYGSVADLFEKQGDNMVKVMEADSKRMLAEFEKRESGYLAGKNEILDLIRKNSESDRLNVEAIENELRLLLMNSVMDQFPWES